MMQPTWQTKDGSIRLYLGDCRDVLPLAEPVDTVACDPPYELTNGKKGGSGPASVNLNSPYGRARITTGFMGKAWDGTGVAFDPETWAKVLESAKPGAMLLAFGGTRTYHRMTCAIEDAGFEIRDCLAWLYGQGFPKSLDISKAIDAAAGVEREVVAAGKPVKWMIPGADQNETGWIKDNGREYVPTETVPATEAAKTWDGYGTALKPAFEPIVLAMRPLDGTYAENAQKHGVAGLNIDGTRIEITEQLPAYKTHGSGQVGSGGIYEGGYAGTPTVIENAHPQSVRHNAAGRWPANVILDAEAGTMLDEQVGPQKSGGTPPRRFAAKTKNAYGQFNGEENPNGIGSSEGAVSRFFYCPKADETDRAGSKHPTVKPINLLVWLCRLASTPTGGTVLDPFMGTGTMAAACWRLGRPYIGIEQDPEYFADAVRRMEKEIKRNGLFDAALLV